MRCLRACRRVKSETMKTIRSGIGFDAHRFAKGRRLILGGVEIKHDAGLAGHSDADVLCHAVIDALLGAVADGDIGRHFPDTDPKWKDADSLDLLERTAACLAELKAVIINIDVTVITEKPKLAPYVDQMRENIARAAGIEKGKVSVKAKTTEQMGFTGRGEGIAAMSVAAVEM